MLLQRELQLQSTSGETVDQEIEALNRPSHICKPNSSNQSNGKYKKLDKVRQAQEAYEQMLDLSQFTQGQCDIPLTLPIPNDNIQLNSRITEFLEQGRSQQLVCLAFDLNEAQESPE